MRATLSDQDLVDVRDPSMADRFGKDCFLDLLLVSPFSSAFADAGFDLFFPQEKQEWWDASRPSVVPFSPLRYRAARTPSNSKLQ